MRKLFTITALCFVCIVANAQTGVQTVLNQLFGQGATTKLENKLSGIYSMIGLNESFSYTFNADSTFSQTIRIGSSVKKLKGTYSLDKTNKINAIYANTGTSLALLYDASDLILLMKKVLSTVSSVTGKTTLATLSALMENYDGALLGYKMKK